MSKSTGSRRSRKAPDRPTKPYAEFPLTPHASGAWQKKIRGQIYYFGKWARRVDGKLTRVEGDGWEAALAEYKAVADDLHAGRTPRVSKDGLLVKDLCNRFLTAKTRKMEADEMGARSFRDYKDATDVLVNSVGANRLVEDLAADDFAGLRARDGEEVGAAALANSITRIKSVFKFGLDNGLFERTVRYGSEFNKPDKAVIRKHKQKMPVKMFEAADLRALIDGATIDRPSGPSVVKPDPTLRAMILLGINCGFGNHRLRRAVVHGAEPRHRLAGLPAAAKTGIPRRVPLWPETVAAIRAAVEVRVKAKGYEEVGLVFLTARGNAFITVTNEYTKDQVAIQFARLLTRRDAPGRCGILRAAAHVPHRGGWGKGSGCRGPHHGAHRPLDGRPLPRARGRCPAPRRGRSRQEVAVARRVSRTSARIADNSGNTGREVANPESRARNRRQASLPHDPPAARRSHEGVSVSTASPPPKGRGASQFDSHADRVPRAHALALPLGR